MVYAAKWIIRFSLATAAADCNAPNWPMSHYIALMRNPTPDPCNTAYRQNSFTIRLEWCLQVVSTTVCFTALLVYNSSASAEIRDRVELQWIHRTQ